jgi:hypothetical protein
MKIDEHRFKQILIRIDEHRWMSKLIETTNQHQHVKTHRESFSNMWMSNIETSTGCRCRWAQSLQLWRIYTTNCSNVSLESQASPTCDGLANINDWWPLCVFQTCGEAYETKINKAYFDLVGGFNSPEKQARRLESSHSTSRYDLWKMGFTPYGLIPTSRTAGPQDLFDPVAAKVMAHLRYCRKTCFLLVSLYYAGTKQGQLAAVWKEKVSLYFPVNSHI